MVHLHRVNVRSTMDIVDSMGVRQDSKHGERTAKKYQARQKSGFIIRHLVQCRPRRSSSGVAGYSYRYMSTVLSHRSADPILA